MKKLLIVSAVLAAVLAGLLVLVVPELPGMIAAKAKSMFVKMPPPEKTLTRVEYYRFDPSSRLEDRIKPMPPELLAHFRSWDQSPDYETLEPQPADKALLLEYLALLPGVYRQVFEERCVGVYFIRGLKGNGVTSWADDKDGKVFFHIALNPESLKKDLSSTLTEREASCFLPREGWSVKVDAGRRYTGLLYALFHEATHAVDYVKGVTPWADNDMPLYLRPASPGKSAIFFKPFWSDFFLPAPGFDYPLRDKITFYGFGGGPKIDLADAPALYDGLAGSPFASLYGSRSWAEDFAELATFHLLTAKLNQPYKIILSGPGARRELEPMLSAGVFQRAALVMNDLDPGGGHIKTSKELDADMKRLDEGLAKARALAEKARKMLEEKKPAK